MKGENCLFNGQTDGRTDNRAHTQPDGRTSQCRQQKENCHIGKFYYLPANSVEEPPPQARTRVFPCRAKEYKSQQSQGEEHQFAFDKQEENINKNILNEKLKN